MSCYTPVKRLNKIKHIKLLGNEYFGGKTELLGWSTCWCCSNSCPRYTRHALHFLLGEEQADPNTQGFPNYTPIVAFWILMASPPMTNEMSWKWDTRGVSARLDRLRHRAWTRTRRERDVDEGRDFPPWTPWLDPCSFPGKGFALRMFVCFLNLRPAYVHKFFVFRCVL